MTTFSRSSDAPAAGVTAASWALIPPLRPHEFRRLRELLYESCGIRLREGKEELVRSRLGRRVVDAGASSFAAYLDRVETDATRRQFSELGALVDALTTNQTAFFREPAHFDFLTTKVLPALAHGTRPVRVWSAGCSTGEEPFTIAALLRDHLPADRFAGARILATDVSSRVLARARAATYGARAITAIPATLRRRMLDVSALGDRFVVRDELRAVVRFARLNLIRDWPLRGPFDAIFCRNVMIYFDAGVRHRLIERFWHMLAPGGHLFVGHSESLGTQTHGFRYVQPAVYVR
ncbi:MAG TPA: protein-glutamate O-methyltransferase CheR [Gemmatimonadaceae bacterium]|nr:protein-glutamate O-methyltransferase CheR [Gemmatimonadaceae bacterium]